MSSYARITSVRKNDRLTPNQRLAIEHKLQENMHDDPKSVLVAFRVSAKLYADFKTWAGHETRNMSLLIRLLMRQHVENLKMMETPAFRKIVRAELIKLRNEDPANFEQMCSELDNDGTQCDSQ